MTRDDSRSETQAARLGIVRVVGTGLLGTSVGLGLAAHGVPVVLDDPSPTALALACDLGAGQASVAGDEPALVVVAVPPDVTAAVVSRELLDHPRAVVTDVASVKSGVLDDLERSGADLTRYVGGHPMAGRERSGPVAARGDLFWDRPWVLCPSPVAAPERVVLVDRLIQLLGAIPVRMGAIEHDEAMALISHVPQLAASLVAARLRDAPEAAVALAGQGLRDVTRIAGSDPMLWAQILTANAAPVVRELRAFRADLDKVIEALGALAEEGPVGSVTGSRAEVARAVVEGNAGRDRIPGKHGGRPTEYAVLTILVPDRPGALGQLFADIGAAGINIEELALEHAPGRAVGLVEVSVLPGVRETLLAALDAEGWHVTV